MLGLQALDVALLYKKKRKKGGGGGGGGGGSARASPVVAPMPKSVYFFREKRGCLDCLVLA